MPSSPKPLDSFALLRSSNVEEVCATLAAIYGRPVLAPTGGVERFNVRMNICDLGGVGLGFASFGCEVEFEFPPSGFVCQVFPLRGGGEISCDGTAATVGPRASALVPADYAHQATFGADYEHLVLQISTTALAKKLEALTEAAVNAPLRLPPLQKAAHPAAQMLQHYLPLFVDVVSGPGCPARCVAEAEDVLMTLFLCGHRHNYSYLLERQPPDTEPRMVHRAEEYIEANAQQAVTLEHLAAAVGVNAFTLFRAFKKYRGYSPQEFLARMRSLRPWPD